jgi:anaerobic magnesium-protoporphyrin IX monomethyl ester cyclase
MMPNVVLINPLWTKRKGNIWRKVGGCLPPLGLGYIASACERRKISVTVIDANAENLDNDQIVARLRGLKFEFVGISATTITLNPALRLAEEIKRNFTSCTMVFGGVHATVDPDSVIKHAAVDYVLRGEAEQSFPTLLLSANPSLIAGLTYKTAAGVVHNPPAPRIADLDSLPQPAWHLLPVNLYRPSLGNYKRLPGVGMIASRGCPGKCTFCFVGTHGETVRRRSARRVVDEIKYLRDHNGIREVSFYDDNFTTSKAFVLEFCSLLADEKVKISWTCSSRVDTVNEQILKTMKLGGCHQISYGVESADEEILKNLNKRIQLPQVKETIRLTRLAGIEAKIFLMFGAPGETVDSINTTLRFAVETKADGFIVSIATPFPGTQMLDWAKEHGYLRILDWERYDVSTPTMELPTIATADLRRAYAAAYRTLYLRPGFLWRKLTSIRSFEDIKKYILALGVIVGL